MPRLVNRIAHYALSAAALDEARTVSADHIRKARCLGFVVTVNSRSSSS